MRTLNRLMNVLRIRLTMWDLCNYNWVVDELIGIDSAHSYF